MKLRLEIFPSFLNYCCIEIVDNTLTFSIEKFENELIKGFINYTTNFELTDNQLDKIKVLSVDVINEAKEDNRLILDGVSLICSMKNKQHKFRCPETDTKEFELVDNYFQLLNSLEKELILSSYLDCLKDYFYE